MCTSQLTWATTGVPPARHEKVKDRIICNARSEALFWTTAVWRPSGRNQSLRKVGAGARWSSVSSNPNSHGLQSRSQSWTLYRMIHSKTTVCKDFLVPSISLRKGRSNHLLSTRLRSTSFFKQMGQFLILRSVRQIRQKASMAFCLFLYAFPYLFIESWYWQAV